MVLLVLTFLKSYTSAENANGAVACCFTFLEYELPLGLITEYRETGQDCTTPGIIFIMKSGHHHCADPGVQWVKEHMDKIGKSLLENWARNS
ncbi:C-C motif chemokine 4 [Clarias magur]|uniref:C-C motif chemokine n=1 Tax=Clarias magur TaxID=1594786 RepID=A0A8J4X1G3_CLAMG|nr:C-C motif chemokine 4 [Clarias magur]